MWRWCASAIVAASMCGCGGDEDGDDVAEIKAPLPMDQVPAAVLKTAKEAAPNLTFFAAYTGQHEGHESIELKGKARSGQIKEVEVSPEGKLLGIE